MLISLGAVSEDNREYYAISTDFDPALVKPFVRDNVVTKLEPKDSGLWKSLTEMKNEFLEFVGTEQAEFWSLNPTYDWYLITWYFLHGWDHLPGNWPFECYDLGQWASQLGVTLPPPDDPSDHNALWDAYYHKQLYDLLCEQERKT